MRLTATPQGQGRPEEWPGPWGCAQRVHRLALGLAPPDAEPGGGPPARSLVLRRPLTRYRKCRLWGTSWGLPAAGAAQSKGRSSLAISRCPCSARRRAGEGRQEPRRRRFLSPRPRPPRSPPSMRQVRRAPCPSAPRRQAPRQRLRVAQPAEGARAPPQQVTRRLLAPATCTGPPSSSRRRARSRSAVGRAGAPSSPPPPRPSPTGLSALSVEQLRARLQARSAPSAAPGGAPAAPAPTPAAPPAAPPSPTPSRPPPGVPHPTPPGVPAPPAGGELTRRRQLAGPPPRCSPAPASPPPPDRAPALPLTPGPPLRPFRHRPRPPAPPPPGPPSPERRRASPRASAPPCAAGPSSPKSAERGTPTRPAR